MAKKKGEQTIEDRNYIKVSIFKDEWEALGISPSDTLKEAVTHIRGKFNLPERYKFGGGKKTAVRNALKEATDEQIEKALETLTT